VFYTHDRRETIKPGTVVKLDISLWPMGMVFAAGEGIMLRVAGHDMCHPETGLIRVKEAVDENVGEHVIHTGGQYDSHLVIPEIPSK
jgi:predicted acyl esterase